MIFNLALMFFVATLGAFMYLGVTPLYPFDKRPWDQSLALFLWGAGAVGLLLTSLCWLWVPL